MILIIDDETRYIQSYIDELELTVGREHQIRVITRVDEALDVLATLRAENKHPDLVILDVMMPPRDRFTAEETNGGIRTGLALLERIATPTCPVLVFTNVSDTFVKIEVEARGCTFVRKADVLPHELAKMVQRILAGDKGRIQT